MSRERRPDRGASGISTLDLLLFTAGFACGWVMHQGSALRTGKFYILPLSRGPFHSLLGSAWMCWIWAVATGVAFLIVGRRFRYDCRGRLAELLAVALAIVLFESVYPAFRMETAGAMIGETAWIEPSAAPGSKFAVGNFLNPAGLPPESPLIFDLWWPERGEKQEELRWIALRLTAAATLIAIAAWCLRAKLSPGWLAIGSIVIAVLVALGPFRLAEATSNEVSSCARNPAYQPSAQERPWPWPWVAADFDARAWAGYSVRALALMTLAMLAARSLLVRWRMWLWTEWAAIGCAGIIGGCWFYDEFVARPALDRSVRVALLGTSLLVIAAISGGVIWGCSALEHRFRRNDAIVDRR
jgi:hypothetical protein